MDAPYVCPGCGARLLCELDGGPLCLGCRAGAPYMPAPDQIALDTAAIRDANALVKKGGPKPCEREPAVREFGTTHQLGIAILKAL